MNKLLLFITCTNLNNQFAVAVEKVAVDVNDKVDLQDTINSMLDIWYELGGEDGDVSTLITPSRRYIRKSNEAFFREAPFSANEPEPIVFYVFNDLLLIGKERKKMKASTLKKGKLKCVCVFNFNSFS